ncbi:unnamed protein product [Vitrella brassicaformis CCMP3155]|uniref:LRAT domain-containing protein n=2 Tax=Vitrella brassicaformis TaxID=1169539 RepID=A0A0G4FMM2_VITBC|nr:unnamed protein product [Vitrella brassicaformis CCMP3155]|mmetsp:Transcript_8008/g.19735  ORF Transcript_8008/g.19735 Transcript_8008/m.19735 type:complete len:189 (+) Transcript_8008:61-627(+)|eukprot:CEM15488.1 unnamed protein product [Vitrella brassicaformis CCMP3155]
MSQLLPLAPLGLIGALRLMRTSGTLVISSEVAARRDQWCYNLRVLAAPILIDDTDWLGGVLKASPTLLYNALTPVRWSTKGYEYIDHHWVQAELSDGGIITVDKTYTGNIHIRHYTSVKPLRLRMEKHNVMMTSVWLASEICEQPIQIDTLIRVAEAFPNEYRLLDDNCKHLSEAIAKCFHLKTFTRR